MRHLKKIAFLIAMMIFGVGGSLFVSHKLLEKHGGLGHISSALEAIRLRSANPTMSPAQIEAEAAKANHGAMGLLKTIANGPGVVPVQNKPAEPVRDELRRHETQREVYVGQTDDKKDVYGVIHETGTEDLSALDKINALNIPGEMKEKILRNYHATGFLPEIVVKAKRAPAAPGRALQPSDEASF